ncbi:MAG TPA: hypothetical protein VF837_02630 [Patescibacteria group bacterium]
MVQSVYAATTNLETIYQPAQALGGQSATIGGFISPILNDVLIVCGLLAFFTIIFSGFQYITAAGDKNKTAQAQNMLNYAIIGLVVIVAAYVITNLVGTLLGFNFLKQTV